MREPAGVAAIALSPLEGVARRGGARGRLGVGIVREPAGVAPRALAPLKRVARGGRLLRGGRVGVVAEPARVAAVALSALEGVADGGAAGGRAAVAAAALLVREAAGVAPGALAALPRVAHGLRGGSLAEAGLLGVLALGAAGGLVLPSLGVVELLLAGGEDELGVAVAAVQGDVLVLLGQGVGVSRGLLMNLELWGKVGIGGAGLDVRLTLGEVGRWGRAVLDHGGDPVGRSAAGGWLANCQKLVRELAPGRERVDELGAPAEPGIAVGLTPSSSSSSLASSTSGSSCESIGSGLARVSVGVGARRGTEGEKGGGNPDRSGGGGADEKKCVAGDARCRG